MLQQLVRRTWAPKGCTPTECSWDRWDCLSVISALAVSPRRRRLGLYFAIAQHSIRAPDVEAFVAEILKHLPAGLILVLDCWQVHRSAARRLLERFRRRLQVEWLPAYAPQLNPDEQVWTQTKYRDLADFLPQDVTHLERAVRQSLCQTQRRQSSLRPFFHHAKLVLRAISFIRIKGQ